MTGKINFLWDTCEGRVTQDQIRYVEGVFNLSFPKIYISLIRECDGGSPLKADFDFIDLFNKRKMTDCLGSFLPFNSSEYGSILTQNLSPPEFFPKGLFSFARNGGGDLICFDYRQGKDNPDPPIVFWSHGADTGKDISFIANNFEEFIGMLREPEDNF